MTNPNQKILPQGETPPYGTVGERDFAPCAEAVEAHRILLSLSERQRGLVLCWFCSACHRYVGPGDHCVCERDE